mgnify:CR=1 FL=1
MGWRFLEALKLALLEAADARRQLDDYKLQAQRLAAERERAARERLAKGLLPVLENFRKAIEFAEGERDPEALREGLRMIWEDALAKLESLGIREIAPELGEEFDPKTMEAVELVEGGEEGRVARLISPGFSLDGKVLKPARVAVYGKKD